MGFLDRFRQLKHAWNVFTNQTLEDRVGPTATGGGMTFVRPDRPRLGYSNERSILSSILTRLAVDASGLLIKHVRVDENGRYLEDIKSGTNDCLTIEANMDQAARQFRMDVVLTMFGNGTCAIVPVDTTLNPNVSGSYDIKTMRVGAIKSWSNTQVLVSLYNEKKGFREDIWVDKKFTAIIENPLYAVMNEPSSTLQRLIRKLNLLDAIDEQSGSGKLDIIIQLPYIIKSDTKRQQADQRRQDLEAQLQGSKYGVAYIDGTEKVIQLNRPAENNLLKQIEFLTEMLYSQLGLTTEVMNGTADEKTMLNYLFRTIEPIVQAYTEAMIRAFLTRTARTQGQSFLYFRDPFKLVPISQVAEIVDVFIRNQVATANDMRQAIGWKPSNDPKADELNNPNMPAEQPPAPSEPTQSTTTN